MQVRQIAFFLTTHRAFVRIGIQIVCRRMMRPDTNPTLADKLATAIADGILDGSLPPGAPGNEDW